MDWMGNTTGMTSFVCNHARVQWILSMIQLPYKFWIIIGFATQITRLNYYLINALFSVHSSNRLRFKKISVDKRLPFWNNLGEYFKSQKYPLAEIERVKIFFLLLQKTCLQNFEDPLSHVMLWASRYIMITLVLPVILCFQNISMDYSSPNSVWLIWYNTFRYCVIFYVNRKTRHQQQLG